MCVEFEKIAAYLIFLKKGSKIGHQKFYFRITNLLCNNYVPILFKIA